MTTGVLRGLYTARGVGSGGAPRAAGVAEGHGRGGPVVAVDDVGLAAGRGAQVLERRAAEKREAVRVVVAAVHAAHREVAVVGLEEDDAEALDVAAEDADMCAAKVEARLLGDVRDGVVLEAVVLRHHHLRAVGRSLDAEPSFREVYGTG